MELLADVPEVVLPEVNEGCKPIWHLFVVQVDDRDAVQKALAEKGVSTALHYPVPLHLQRAYAHLGLSEGTFPVAESYAKRLMSLPMYPELTDDQIEYVCRCLKEAVQK
jgi:dTDP-4-amino-4,6-dideoxygalactose transaminase